MFFLKVDVDTTVEPAILSGVGINRDGKAIFDVILDIDGLAFSN